MEIDLAGLSVSDNKIQFKLHVPKTLRKYFLQDTSYVQYDSAIDLRNVDDSVLAIPMVSLIAPIAWAVGADVRTNELDAAYLQSINKVKHVYRSIYSHFSFSGDIQAKKPVWNEFGGKRTGMLFSGGVDSLTSYLKHRDEKPDMVSIWGLRDIPPFEEKFWSRMWADICGLANHEGVRAFQVKTDMLHNTNHELLSKEFGVSWWGEVAHGLWALGLCAPVTAIRGIGTLIIASTYTEDFEGPTGAHPSVDNNVSWTDVKVVHDGYELSRQQKLQYLCRQENLPYLSYLRVCWDSALKTNCGNCEKCVRTIVGLVTAGVDPNNCNFDIDAKTLPRIKDCFLKGKMALREGELFDWVDLQRHIPERIDADISGSREFLPWLRKFDLSRYKTNKLRRFLHTARRICCSRRTKAPSVKRKMKCYYYIALARLKLL